MRIILYWFVSIAALFVVMVLYPYVAFRVFDGSWEKMAFLGGAFGAVSALFSSLAFIGVAISLFIQRKELAQQRRSAEVQSKQNLLSCKISAAISKQEILAQFLVGGRVHPHFKISDQPGDYRETLAKNLAETEGLVSEAEHLLKDD
ncbi:hypothetical protein KZO83_07070 [Chromohalobacter sp. TMW 2.2308]|uniref:DUF6082 family protein n=1 Tax=Chromohalobacter TaxID=42054 RepID=UPI001FFD4E53|nr:MULTISPECIES: DUF6082 family protein [Chromohalobacter]MCK2042448.1 hypothetical protein [Chromohalobacter moromii]MCT8515033.1 hypothetical protein [Chromohalobacter sp. TMW 2.2271]